MLNVLSQVKDTHGAHIDTYAYTWLTVIEAPNEGNGGCLELVPGVTDAKAIDGPEVIRIYPKPGDCIFLAANNTIHRVAPLTHPSRRLVFASAFANEGTLNKTSYSSKSLYG